jgi:HD domain
VTTLRRWRPQDASSSRAGLAVVVNLVPAVVALGLFAVLRPEASWDQPVLLAALAAMAAIAFLAEVKLKTAAASYFDASIVLALLALVIAGPLPALLVWAVPDAMSRFVLRQDPRVSPGLVATISSFGLALLAGYAVLQLSGAQSLPAATPALFTAGLVMWAVNFSFARLTFAPFYQGFRPIPLIRTEFLDLVPLVLGMLVLGMATAVMIPPLGVFALVPLALVVVLPQLAVSALTRRHSVARLSSVEATALYAEAIADILELPRRERRIIACTAELVDQEIGGGGEALANWHLQDVPEVVMATLHVDERWDGTGWPAGLREAHSPLPSRVVAVARAWARLTADGTVALPHNEAILDLATDAGQGLDPTVVDAAARVVDEERAFVRTPDFQPRLHQLPLPRPLRRGHLPAVLAHLSEPA